MFTGIVQGKARVVHIERQPHFRTHVLELADELRSGLVPGASVAHNGCCLTVTRIEGTKVHFDLIDETLRVTNLGALKEGDWVNIERAARFGDEIGGHLLSGHILGVGTVVEVVDAPPNRSVRIELPAPARKYVLTKGYIGVDGVSLTVGAVTDSCFSVHLIPETLARTVLSTRRVGDAVNIEVDSQTQAIVDTVERVLASRAPNGLT
jgi:riboflavin synthase